MIIILESERRTILNELGSKIINAVAKVTVVVLFEYCRFLTHIYPIYFIFKVKIRLNINGSFFISNPLIEGCISQIGILI